MIYLVLNGASLGWFINQVFCSYYKCFIGTETDFFAGLRGCRCLENHYRTNMFKECKKCEVGLECKDDYATLKPGYWWSWRIESYKDHYQHFIKNLLTSTPALGKTDIQYPHPIPTPYRCPLQVSCEGGLDSRCKIGYNGPLCSVCSSRYYKQFHSCKRCPSKTWIAGQLCIIAAIILIIVAFSAWSKKVKNGKIEGKHSLTDTFLSKIKIVIGFYQVTNGLLDAFSYISWPDSLQLIGKYSAILQLGVLQIAPVSCIFDGWHVDAFGNLLAIMTINACLIGFAWIIYFSRKTIISQNRRLEEEEMYHKISELKETVYRNLFFALYVTFLSTCSKATSVLPIACWKLCQDKEDENCSEYLRADYSVKCDDSRYKSLEITAYLSVVYIIALPVATFISLWRCRRSETSANHKIFEGRDTELVRGLSFLFEDYKDRSWYWEMVEMSRKFIVTSGLVMVGSETRSYVGLTWIIGGMYGVLFSFVRPIQDDSQNSLMTASLAVTIFNLGIGAVSRIPAETLPASDITYMNSVAFDILILGANTLVMGLLIRKMFFFYLNCTT